MHRKEGRPERHYVEVAGPRFGWGDARKGGKNKARCDRKGDGCDGEGAEEEEGRSGGEVGGEGGGGDARKEGLGGDTFYEESG